MCELDCRQCCQHDVCCIPKSRPSWLVTVPKERLLSKVNKHAHVAQNLKLKIIGLEKNKCQNEGNGNCKACRFAALCPQRRP